MTAGDDNKVAPRPVQAGEWHGKDWVILGGLKAGDKVIVDNLMKLKPGAPVAPHAPGAQPGGPGAAPAKDAAAPAKGDANAAPAKTDAAPAPAKKD
jgi:membrane fusion protein (multidrug efflux system)